MIKLMQLRRLKIGTTIYDKDLNEYKFMGLIYSRDYGGHTTVRGVTLQPTTHPNCKPVNYFTDYNLSGFYLSPVKATKVKKLRKLNQDYVDPRQTEAEDLMDQYKNKYKTDDDKLRELVTEIELDAFDSTFDNVLSNTDRRRR